MLKLNNISKQFGEHVVFKSVNLVFGNSQVVGIIGDNGTGKTTLLAIMNQQIKPDQGTVETQQEVIEYLPQHPIFPASSVEEFLSKRVAPQEEYRIDIALSQVGLEYISKKTAIETLSGGQKTRLYLAYILLADPEPTMLLLDEPTNNLDRDGIVWMEEFIQQFRGAVIIVSHDRALLDNVADTIIEIENADAKIYGGNYSFYLEQKEIERAAYERRYKAQEKKRSQIEDTIDAMKTRARHGEEQFSSHAPGVRRKIRKSAQQAVHRQHALERFLNSTDYLVKPEDRWRSFIHLSGEVPSDKTILYVKNVSKQFDDGRGLKPLSLHISGHEHVWLSGKNGTGKTTFFKLLTRELFPDSGTIEFGESIKTGYFSQDRQDVNPENTILEELTFLGLTPTEAYKTAILFYFERDQLNSKIKDLSQGQKAKVAFAKLIYGNYQLLLLDEPTNHLEIKTREIIEKALREYNGAILVSSHDRYFLEEIGIHKSVELP